MNTAQEFDGSDAGASPDEAVSWGKIRITAKPVKVSARHCLGYVNSSYMTLIGMHEMHGECTPIKVM